MDFWHRADSADSAGLHHQIRLGTTRQWSSLTIRLVEVP